jgi:hypothetical protein
MTDGFWTHTRLMGAVFPLIFLLAAGQFALLLWLLGRLLRRRTAKLLREVAEHVSQIEERLNRLEYGGASRPECTASLLTRADVPRADDPPLRPTLIAIPDLSIDSQPSEEPLDSGLAQRNAVVWSLAASEMAADEIARRTGHPIGQVELIVGLYRQLHPARGQTQHARSG